MWTQATGITGIGYEDRTLDSLTHSLDTWGVTALFDVRLNAISRKPGFSKRRLAEHLVSHGIMYYHLPELGNSRDNRDGYSQPDSVAGQTAQDRFCAGLVRDQAQMALQLIAKTATTTHVAVLCFEAVERCCHRRQVIDAVDRLLASPVVA